MMNSFYKNATQTRITVQSTLTQTKINQRTRVELFNQLTQGNLLEQKKQAVQQIGERIKCLEQFTAEQKQMKSQHLQYLQIEIIALQQNQKDILNAQNVAAMQSVLIRLPSNQQFIVLNKNGQEVRIETKYLLNYITSKEELNQYLDSLQPVQPYGDEYSIYFNEKHRQAKNVFDRERLDDSIKQNAQQISKLNDRLAGNFQNTQSLTEDQNSIFEQSRCQSGLQYNQNQKNKYNNVQSRYLNYTKMPPKQPKQQYNQVKQAQKTPASSTISKETGKQKIYMNPIQQMMRNKQQKQQSKQQQPVQQAQQKQQIQTKQEVKSQKVENQAPKKTQEQVINQQENKIQEAQKEQPKDIEQPKIEPQPPIIFPPVEVQKPQHDEIPQLIAEDNAYEDLQEEIPQLVTNTNDAIEINLQPDYLNNVKPGQNYEDLLENLNSVKDTEISGLNIELQTNFAALAEEERRKAEKKQTDDIIELSESSNDFDDPSDNQQTKQLTSHFKEEIKSHSSTKEWNGSEVEVDKAKNDNQILQQEKVLKKTENSFLQQNDVQEERKDFEENNIDNYEIIQQNIENQSKSSSLSKQNKCGFDNDNLFAEGGFEENGFEQPYNPYEQINNAINGEANQQNENPDSNQYDFEFNF